MKQINSTLLDVPACASLMGTADGVVYSAIRRGALRAAKKRPIIVVRLSDLNAWEAARLANPRRGGRPRVLHRGIVRLQPEGAA